jgi:imidazole glycerol-phosphate synthase subunit HisF
MLRKRIVTVLTFCDGVLFRTKLFNPDYRYTLNFVDAWSVDEIVALDITRPGQGKRENFFRILKDFASNCFVPVSAGGGIHDMEDVKAFLDTGADKVVINSGAIERPELISDIARSYGSQCVIVSVDAKLKSDGTYEVMSHFGERPTGMTPIEWSLKAEEFGAGEILITSIDRDGWLQGFDIELCRSVAEAVNIPTLILGGAGNWKHMSAGIHEGLASAVCTQNIYHFTETSIRSAKEYLAKRGHLIRQ